MTVGGWRVGHGCSTGTPSLDPLSPFRTARALPPRYCPGSYSPGLQELFDPNATHQDGVGEPRQGDDIDMKRGRWSVRSTSGRFLKVEGL